jgi:HEAT repeat protein
MLPVVVLSVLALPAGFVAVQMLGRPGDRLLIIAALLVFVQGAAFSVELVRSEGWTAGFGATIAAIVLVACELFGVWSVGPVEWYKAFLVITAVGFLIQVMIEEQFAPTVGLMLVASLGGVMAGASGATLGAALYLLALVMLAVALEFAARSEYPALRSALDRLERWTHDVFEPRLLSPGLLVALACSGRLPHRRSGFLDYAINALLLKRSSSDVEFMHRLLRDYFALRTLQPLFGDPDLERRTEAIRNLGFQGEAAIDPLAEFARDTEPRIREAAVTGFGRNAAPQVDRFLDAALDDPEPIVRRSAVLASRNRGDQGHKRLTRLATNETDRDVGLALLEELGNVGDVGLLKVEEKRAVKQVLTNNPGKRELLAKLIDLVGAYRFDLDVFDQGLPAWADEEVPGFLADADPTLRIGALRILRATRTVESVSTIIRAMREDQSASVRGAAAKLLGQRRDREVVEPLIQALADPDASVRQSAAGALGAIKDTRAVAPLKKLLKDRSRAVRSAAAWALRRLVGTLP